MPPPPPNFLPASRRRHLDPTRHLKSRELWNQVRFHATAHQHSNDSNPSSSSSSSSSNRKWFTSLLHAIAYELQPFRIKPCLNRVKIFIVDEGGIQSISSILFTRTKSTLVTILQLLQLLSHQLQHKMNLHTLQSFTSTHKSLLTKTTLSLLILRLYYTLLLTIHELLHAGPIFLIATLLTLLYTIGLGDNTGAGSGIPSAYSVFNRGMERIMGTVDGEELARQYAGGAAMMMGGAGNVNVNMNHPQGNNMNGFDDDHDNDDDGGFWVQDQDRDGEEEEEEERNLVNERRRQRRLERLEQQRQRNGGDAVVLANNDIDGNDDDIQPHDNDDAELIEEEDDPNNNEPDANSNNANGANNTGAAGRKSGKKARRRNLELRREMQRQRQAAAAMGFGAGVDGGGADDEMEARVALG